MRKNRVGDLRERYNPTSKGMFCTKAKKLKNDFMNISVSYEHINLLLILLGLAVIIHFLVLRTTRKRTLYFSNYALLERILGRKVLHQNYPALALRMTIIILLILAISDFKLVLELDVASFDYVIAVDTSPSMSMNFRNITAITMDFLDSMPKETRVGLVTFSKESYVRSTLTQDYGRIKKGIFNLTVGVPPGTAIGKGLLTSSNVLDESLKPNRTIILITDGNIEEELAIDLNKSLDSIRAKNISVFVMGINNTEYSSDYELPSRLRTEDVNGSVSVYGPVLDEETLMLIANQTRGQYYEITDKSSMEDAFENIILLQRQEIVLDARSYVLVLLALLIFIEWGLGATKFKTVVVSSFMNPAPMLLKFFFISSSSSIAFLLYLSLILSKSTSVRLFVYGSATLILPSPSGI